ncbi:MAG: 1-deoxy-D-xylulose-5-phosphate synthase [Flavobacteriaceae bacterium]|nr:1-deoxy-D-xylulose-5-phosphate synthase [Flavobacteriaceae bacterium]
MKTNLLQHIDSPQDLKKLHLDNLPQLAKELREFIINIVATKEGHLGASLGVIELTIALHYVFNTPSDLLIWDVGHQAYGHKILTGRKDIFHTNRQFGGISGFPKRNESNYDTFGVGHSSTSISAALGMAIASQLKGDFDKHHIAVIGDASIASGMAFEGLNHAGVTSANLLIILNDNEMGIDPNVGALKEYLSNLKKNKKDCNFNIFEALNFAYFGPIDGHNIFAVITELKRLKTIKGPKFLHLITIKGKGLKKAEQEPTIYHAPGKFDKISGERMLSFDTKLPLKFQDVFGLTLVELAKKNKKIISITPAMPTGSSLKYMIKAFPDRSFDVGIAEQHAVTLAAGMATQGFIPFCVIYSTFLQRAYDQIIHDVALQKLPVIFCIDRAGLVGEDGATHHGVFDLAYLRLIPNLIITAPLNYEELRNLLYTAQLGLDKPIAIRYPRGRMKNNIKNLHWKTPYKKITIGKGSQITFGNKVAILSIGTIGNTIIKICEEDYYLDKISHYNMLFVKPLDEKLLHQVCENFDKIITIEEATIIGGLGTAILEFLHENNYQNIKLKRLGIPDNFIEHGKTSELNTKIGLDIFSIKKRIDTFL